MNHFTKIADVDVGPLNAQLAAHPELWNRHGYRKAQKAHAGMSDIWLRYRDFRELDGPGKYREPHIPVWYPAWPVLTEAKPIILDLMTRVEGEMLCGVLITKIPPGEGIKAHVDGGWHVEYTEKLYVCLESAPGALFVCNEGQTEALNPKAGEVWLFDNRKNHWVENNSDRDRVTMIVCIRTEKYGRA